MKKLKKNDLPRLFLRLVDSSTLETNDRHFVNDWEKCRGIVIVNEKKKKKVREGSG